MLLITYKCYVYLTETNNFLECQVEKEEKNDPSLTSVRAEDRNTVG